MEKVIVDSDILIFVSRDDPSAISFVDRLENTRGVAISAVSAFELIIGSRDKNELSQIKKFLNRFEHLHIDEETSATALTLLEQFTLSHGLLMPDALIAATALVNKLDLGTINRKDFRFIEGLRLVNYP